MGIPSYFSYIVKNHPEILKQFSLNKFRVNNLYMDCNSIIYDIVANYDYAVKQEMSSTIIRGVIAKIEEYVRSINPTSTAFIAFDGVAPVAKLDQQRSRRVKSAHQNEVHRQLFNKNEKDVFNTASITPGTQFMKELSEQIYAHFEKRNNVPGSDVQNMIVSCSDSAGEGEHKLFQYIREEPEKHANETTVIYGLDADLIMLSLNHLPICPQLFLFRETPEFIKSIDSTLSPNELYIMDMGELSKNIGDNMIQPGVTITDSKRASLVHDYIFICFFLGNDFLPHFPALNIRTGGVNKMIDAYRETMGASQGETLIKNGQICWANVRVFVDNLASKEVKYIQNEAKLRDSRERRVLPSETPEEKFTRFENVPAYNRELEKMINPFRPFWQKRYYNTLLLMSPADDMRKSQVSLNYLEGLEWTFKYYTTGCPDWRWSYQHHYPPLLEDLCKYVPIFEKTLVPLKPKNPVNPLTQLCYVLPSSSMTLLPPKLHHLLITEKPEWYSKKPQFVWAYCKYFWESHAILSDIDIDELEEVLSKQP